jgi:predicted CXXCH cytochrome family protein
MRTTHRLSLQVPGLRGAFQDPSVWPDLDKGISLFDQSATLYYYDCDPADAEGPCRVSSTDPTLATPSAVISFELQLTRNPTIAKENVGAYTLTIVNRAGSGSASYDVALSYGGFLSKQHYLTRIPNGDGSFSYYLLPLQYNVAGDDGADAFRDWVWRDYRSSDWYDLASSKLVEPGAERSFDAQCAGCHLTGMRLAGSAQRGWTAHAVGDLSGDFDYDGDGRREEINVGCESCHGPASEHLEAKVRGVNIVSPSLLTPERELLLCGRCHSRAQGHGGDGSEAPLSADGRMPPAGLRRAELASAYAARVDGDAEDFYPSGDSRAQHAQYSDFLRTTMHRNGSVLMTCTSCHDAHGSDENAHELRQAADDNTACTGCHSEDKYVAPRQHVEAATGFVHDGSSDSDFVCTRCHMVRTISSGARHPELLDKIPSSPTVQYYHGDIASHRFVVTRRAHYAEQPIAATLRCGFCHGTDFANP